MLLWKKLEKKMHNYFVFFMLICSFFLNSCTPMGAIVTTTSAGAVVAESDRTVGEATDDTFIKLKIAEKYVKSKSGLLLDIDTSVRLGTVLLTGIVENQEIRIEAVKLAWEVNGVKEVLNEIEIGNTQKIKDYAEDLWISSRVRALTLKEIGLSTMTYNFETINGKVHIMGVAPNIEESDRIVSVIKNIKGVKEIVNHIIIKSEN